MAESPGGASQLAGHVVTIDSDDSSEAAPGNAAGKRLRVDASAGPLARAFARACPGGTLEGAAPSSHGGASQPSPRRRSMAQQPELQGTSFQDELLRKSMRPTSAMAMESCGGGRREHRTTAKTRGLCSITMILAALQSLLASPLALLENAAVLHSLRRSGSG